MNRRIETVRRVKMAVKRQRKKFPTQTERKRWKPKEFFRKKNNFKIFFYPVNESLAPELDYVIAKRIGLDKKGNLWKEFESKNRSLVDELKKLSEKLGEFGRKANALAIESLRQISPDGRQKLIAENLKLNVEIERFCNETGYYNKLYKAYKLLVKMGAKNIDLI